MSTIKNRTQFIICICLSFILGLSTCYIAYADNETSPLGVGVVCDSSITLTDNDIFELSITNSDTGETSTLDIDALSHKKGFTDYYFPYGNYEITNIKYKGDNSQITDQGYGVERNFYLKENDDDIIHIRIGSESTQELYRNTVANLIVTKDSDENGNQEVFTDRNGGKYRIATDENGEQYAEYIDEPSNDIPTSEKEDKTYSDVYGSISSSSSSAQNGSKTPETEYYGSESISNDNHQDSIGTTLIIIAIVTIIGLAGILFVWKRQKK